MRVPSPDPEQIRELERFGNVITPQLVESDEPLAFGRDPEIDLLLHHFDHARQNSMVLVGPSGCGKTAILYEFFRRIGRRREPWQVLETSCANLLAGTRYLGEWESRVHDLMKVAKGHARVALYFTDVANLVTAGKASETTNNLAMALAPVIERREVVIIGECTEEVFRQCLAPQVWFAKLFGMMRVAAQSDEAAAQVIQHLMQGHAQGLARELNVDLHWDAAVLSTIDQLGRIYFPGYSPPGGSARLIDLVVSGKRAEIERTPRRATNAAAAVAVTSQDCIAALESFTGIPGMLLDDSRRLVLDEVRERFRSRIVGQDDAVDTIVDLIALIKAGLTDPKKPLGVLFFVGPTGVGKTELAKALAEFIFGNSDRMIRYDMSEFKDYNSFEKLIGKPQFGAQTTAHGGSLLNRVREQPFSLILLDEIEKAHSNIYDLLLQLFDDGRLSDPTGRAADFTQTIIILTSNLGSEISDGAPFGFGQEAPRPEDAVMEAMKGFFRPELINRIHRIVHFQPLTRDHVRLIAQRELGDVLMRSGILRRQLRVDVDRGVIDILADAGFHPAFGARPLKRAVERLALIPIAREIVGVTEQKRPALLRLLPSGKRIVLDVVYDRPGHDANAIAQAVKITSPVDGQKSKETLADVGVRLERGLTLVEQIERDCQSRGLAEKKAALVARTGQINFWDDVAAARETMGDLYRLERGLEAVGQLRQTFDKLAARGEHLKKAATEPGIRKLAQEIMIATVHAEVLTYSLRCDDKLDRCDAFVVVTAAEPLEVDLVGRLADMYSGWAARKGFRARIVNEELFSRDATKEIVLLLEGVAIYGLLRAEMGVHEFVAQKTSKSTRQNWFVTVNLLPILESATPGAGCAVETVAAKGAGVRCRRYRSRSTATDTAGRKVAIQNGLERDEADQVAIELLEAERWRVENSAELVRDVVRRYVLKPNQSAKDLRTGVTTHRLDDLFEGALDEFLKASLDARQRG